MSRVLRIDGVVFPLPLSSNNQALITFCQEPEDETPRDLAGSLNDHARINIMGLLEDITYHENKLLKYRALDFAEARKEFALELDPVGSILEIADDAACARAIISFWESEIAELKKFLADEYEVVLVLSYALKVGGRRITYT